MRPSPAPTPTHAAPPRVPSAARAPEPAGRAPAPAGRPATPAEGPTASAGRHGASTTRVPASAARRPEPPLRVLVGAVLRDRRERQGRTLRDVAADARVSVPYLSEVERGRKEASSEVLGAVCRALGMRLVDLVGEAHARLAAAEGRVVLDLAAAPAPGPLSLTAVRPLPTRPTPDVVALAA